MKKVTFYEVLLDLATEEMPHVGNAIAVLAALSVQIERQEKKIASLEDAAASKDDVIRTLRRELEIEQGKAGIVGIDHKKMANKLVLARNLLAEWLEHGTNATTADNTRNFLKELSE